MMDFKRKEGTEVFNNKNDETNIQSGIPVSIPRCPVVLVLDTSHSMWPVLSDLKNALRSFYNTVQQTQFENAKIDLAVVSMGEKFGMLEDFTAFEYSQIANLPIRPKGDTPMGQALMLALDKLEEQKKYYCRIHQNFVTPQVILLSDGKTGDDVSEAAERINSAIRHGKLLFRTIALGASPNLGILNQFDGCVIKNINVSELHDSFKDAGIRVSKSYEAEVVYGVGDDLLYEYKQCPVEKKMYILDGSNIIHWNDMMNGVRLQNVLALINEIKARNMDYIVFFDASARHQMVPGDAAKYEHLLKNDPEHFRQVPAKNQADDFILHLADITPESTIISGDTYHQYENQYVWLKGHTKRVVSGMVFGNEIFIPKLSWSIPIK